MNDALLSLPPLREVIRAYGLSAKKNLGQNFLFDGNLLDRIARVPGPLAGQKVYEVGPGPGGLTRALLRAGAEVTAVERDARCLAALADLNAASGGHVHVINADALTVDEQALGLAGAHIVANLPYNIGTALLVRWLTTEDFPPWWQSLTLMFQKEVAQRIVAHPDTDAYGRLSVLAQLRTEARIMFEVSRSAFTPPPKVASAVVHLRPLAQAPDVAVSAVAHMTAAAFGQRRKMLRAALKSLPHGLDALEASGISGERRAETLSVQDYIHLARLWSQIRRA